MFATLPRGMWVAEGLGKTKPHANKDGEDSFLQIGNCFLEKTSPDCEFNYTLFYR